MLVFVMVIVFVIVAVFVPAQEFVVDFRAVRLEFLSRREALRADQGFQRR